MEETLTLEFRVTFEGPCSTEERAHRLRDMIVRALSMGGCTGSTEDVVTGWKVDIVEEEGRRDAI